MAKKSIIPWSDDPEVNIITQVKKIISYDSAIIDRMLKTFEDSKGEILDSRLLQFQKIIIDAAKMLKDLDPVLKKQEMEMQVQADIALEIYKKQVRERETKFAGRKIIDENG